MVKDLIREIKSRAFQFIALTLITTLGVGFFVGIQVTGYNMRKTGDAYMDERSVLDYLVQHSLGVDDEMIEEIEALIGGDITGVYETDMYGRSGAFDSVIKVYELNDVTQTDLTLVEGTMPNQALEIVMDTIMQEKHGFKIGDTLKLMKNDIFDTADVKITGFVESSLFMNLERGNTKLGVGTVSGYIYAKDLPKLHDPAIYSGVRISNIDNDISLLERNEEAISQARFDRVIKPEIEKLIDAQVELDEAKIKANLEFEKAEKAFVDAQVKLDQSKKQLEDAINQLSFIPITTGTLDERLEFANASYIKTKEGIELAINSVKKQIESSNSPEIKEYLETQLDIYTKDLYEMNNSFLAGYKQVENGVKAYNEGVSKLADEKLNFASEKEKALSELASAQSKIDSGYEAIEKQDHGSLYIRSREDVIIGYKEFYDDSTRIEKIGQVFPIIFFLVSILITLSTLTRMIDENRMEMGVYKALGYSSLRTSMKYVYFTFLSWFLGTILGLYFGFYFIPSIIYDAYRIMYQTPDMVGGVVFSYAWTPVLISFISSVGVTFIKSMRVAKERTSQLLRPVAPQAGQRILLERIPFLWHRFSFLYKVSFRNLFRNKTRFLMTLLGIGGTTGLLIVGFGIEHSIYSIVDKQFEEIIQYDGLVFYDEDDFTRDDFTYSIDLYVESAQAGRYDLSVYAPEDILELNDFINLQDRKTHKSLELNYHDIIITEKLARLLNVQKGGQIELTISDKNYSFNVNQVTENYANHYVYLSQETLEDIMDQSLDSNVTLFKTESTDTDAMVEDILKSDNVLTVQLLGELKETYRDMMQSFDIVIWVVVGAALALEVLVLTNLISMNMAERKKELATLKVLGFNTRELSSYILRENIILTLLSALFGFVFGKILHYFVVTQAEIDMVMFNYELQLSSYVIAFVLTLGLSIIINYWMAKKANKVNMSEALKGFDE